MQFLQWLLQHCADAGSIIESVVLSPTGSLRLTAAQKLVDSALDMEIYASSCQMSRLTSQTGLDRPEVAHKEMHYQSTRDFERLWIVSSLQCLLLPHAIGHLPYDRRALVTSGYQSCDILA